MTRLHALIFILSLSSFFTVSSLHAQDYQTGFGVRAGSANGFTIKHFVGGSLALEGLAVYHQEGLHTHVLVEQHLFMGRHSNTSIFFGVGGHAGYQGFLTAESTPTPVAGLDAILGFEYVFPNQNISFTLDVKPMLHLTGTPTFSGNQAGVSLRFLMD